MCFFNPTICRAATDRRVGQVTIYSTINVSLFVKLLEEPSHVYFFSFLRQLTYWGRLKRCLDVTDPRTLFVSEVCFYHLSYVLLFQGASFQFIDLELLIAEKAPGFYQSFKAV